MRIVVDASGLASASQEARDYFRSVIRNLIAQGSAHSLALAGWPGDACGDPASFLAPLPRVGAAWTVVRDPQDRAASVVFSPLGPHRLACLEFVPAVATILDPPPSPLEARTLRSWTRRPGTKLVTLTRASLDLLVGSVGVPASRVAWIPPGAGLTAGWEAPAEDGGSLPSSPYIVTSGTGETRGFSDLVEGLHLYRRTWSRDVRLLVLERAPKSWERLAARRGLSAAVQFVGELSATARARVIVGARAFVPSGRGDRTWLLAGEALRAGVPVVAPREPALVEILGDVALYHSPGNVTEMALGIWRCLECREVARELAQRAIARAHTFSWEASTVRLLDLLAAVG